MLVYLMLLLVQQLPLDLLILLASVELAQNVHSLLPALNIAHNIRITQHTPTQYYFTSNFISTTALG